MTEQQAMRLALEALENSVDLVMQDAYNAEQLYGNYPARQAKVGGLKLLAEEHQKAITALRQALANEALDRKAENARELGLDYEVPTLLPDGSAFGVMSFPLPSDHWIYAPNEYKDGEDEPIDLPKPILTHAMRDAVVAAVRYAVRGATMRGQENDFDPDALVQNAVYALCGPYGKALEQQPADEPVALRMDVIVVNLVREGINKHRARELAEHFIKHTTTPPQRKPLTDDEITLIIADCASSHQHTDIHLARAIEQAHGIKGEA